VPRWADHFVAITDAGTALETRARAEGFRDLFINPSDIGGRYSAVSYFGLVPAALMGLHVAVIVAWAQAMLAAVEPGSVRPPRTPPSRWAWPWARARAPAATS
jgi:glucose-6-phosphate isomerase